MRVLDWAVFNAHPARLHSSFSNYEGRHVCDPQLVFDLTQRDPNGNVTLEMDR